MELRLDELSHMLRGGNKLTTIVQPVKETRPVRVEEVVGTTVVQGVQCAVVRSEEMTLTEGHGWYRLENDCTYLEGKGVGAQCTAYDQRPGICKEFTEGGQGCLDAREILYDRGTFPDWQPVELRVKPPVT
jgi:Fe-S-cluster containining protein